MSSKHELPVLPAYDLAGLPADEAAHVATERLRIAITKLEESLA